MENAVQYSYDPNKNSGNSSFLFLIRCGFLCSLMLFRRRGAARRVAKHDLIAAEFLVSFLGLENVSEGENWVNRMAVDATSLNNGGGIMESLFS